MLSARAARAPACTSLAPLMSLPRPIALALATALLLASCGGQTAPRRASGRSGRPASHRASAAAPRTPRPLALVDRPRHSLPAPLRDPAAVALGGGRLALLGGLDA